MKNGDLVKIAIKSPTTLSGSIGVVVGDPEIFGFITRYYVMLNRAIGQGGCSFFEWIDAEELEKIDDNRT